MKELLFTDTHYRLPTAGKSRDLLKDEYWNTAVWIASLASEHKVSKIRILGDIFDQNVLDDIESWNLFTDMLAMWSTICTVYLMKGNHDEIKEGLHNLIPFRNFHNVVVLDKPSWHHNVISRDSPDPVEFITADIPYMKDYSCMDSEMKERLAQARIIFAHSQWRGGKLTQTQISDHGLDTFLKLESDQLLILGDYHIPQKIQDNVYALGSLRQSSFRDVGGWSRGVWILDYTTMGLELIENPYSPIYQILETDDQSVLDEGVTNILDSCVDEWAPDKNKARQINLMLKIPESLYIDDTYLRSLVNLNLRIVRTTRKAGKFVSLSSSADLSSLFSRYLTTKNITDDETKKLGLEYLNG